MDFGLGGFRHLTAKGWLHLEFLDARREFERIARRVGESILAVAKQFAAGADAGSDYGQAAGHGFEGNGGKRLIPFGGIEQGVMLAIDCNQVPVLVRHSEEFDRQRVLDDERAQF